MAIEIHLFLLNEFIRKGENMPLFTTYLAFLKKGVGWFDDKPTYISTDDRFQKGKFLYVMRNRGNNEVAPNEDMLRSFKKLALIQGMTKELWEQYEENYLIQIGLSPAATDWMKRVANQSLKENVVLVCYEKDSEHCHRTLLAREIMRRYPKATYKGELHGLP